jgi:hypothetical protein
VFTIFSIRCPTTILTSRIPRDLKMSIWWTRIGLLPIGRRGFG